MEIIISKVIQAYLLHLNGNDIMASVLLQESGETGKILYLKMIKELELCN